jgi:SAM-dependent methyltransferase
MRKSSQKHRRVFWNHQASSYKVAQWTGTKIADFDYVRTKKALLGSLNPIKKNNILEIGCGPGVWSNLIAPKCSKLVAVDISEKMIEKAKEYKQKNIVFINTDFMDFNFKEKFDKIFSVRAFEYIINKKIFFSKSYSLLKPKGELILIIKTKNSIWDFYKRFKKHIKFYEGKNFDEVRLYSWYENVSINFLKNILESNNFIVIDILPVVIRLPVFKQGNDEIPIISKKFEKIFLRSFDIISNYFSKLPTHITLLFSESYLIHAVKKDLQKTK